MSCPFNAGIVFFASGTARDAVSWSLFGVVWRHCVTTEGSVGELVGDSLGNSSSDLMGAGREGKTQFGDE